MGGLGKKYQKEKLHTSFSPHTHDMFVICSVLLFPDQLTETQLEEPPAKTETGRVLSMLDERNEWGKD